MPEKRKFPVDLTYSEFHRTGPSELGMIDVDGVEYDRGTDEPLLLVEVTEDRGQRYKNTSIIRKLARLTPYVGALLAYYKKGSRDNPLNPLYKDIEVFTKISCVWPNGEKESWENLSRSEYFDLLKKLRAKAKELRRNWKRGKAE